MNDETSMDGALERLEAPRLEAALAPLRPDPEAFRAGVERKLAERAGEERVESATTRAWPAWARRAAAVLPPGALEAFTVAKSAGPATSAAAWTSLAMPWVLIFFALAGAITVGRRSRRHYEDAAGELGFDRRLRTRATLAMVAILLAPIASLLIVGPVAALYSFLVVCVLLAVVAAWTLERLGLADRDRLGFAFASLLPQAALMLAIAVGPTWDGHLGRWSTHGVPVVLACGGVAMALLCSRPRRRPVLWQSVAMALFLVVHPALIAAVVGGPIPPKVEQHRRWAASFEEPVAELGDWRNLGTLALAFQALGQQVDESFAPRARAVLEREVAAGEVPHPATLLGAARAHAAAPPFPSDIGTYSDRILAALDGPPTLRPYRSFDWWSALGTRELVESDGFDHALRKALAGELEAAWPEPGSFRALARMLEAAEIADLLGADDVLARRADDVSDALLLAWVGRNAVGSGGGGFEPNTPTVSGPPRSRASEEESLAGVLLMARFGVPDGIDLTALNHYLRAESRGKHSLGRPAAQARLVLLEAIGLPRRSPSAWALGELPFLLSLLVVAFVVALVGRAPPAQS